MNNKDTQVIESLSGDDTSLLEFIPYILQDLYSLGTDRELLVSIIQRNQHLLSNVKSVLDLCCGKGASIITLAQKFGWSGRGIDLFEPFISDARKKAFDNNVSDKVIFDVMDITEAINDFKNYDIVLYGSDVPSLGRETDALKKISKCAANDGFIIYETAYLSHLYFDSELRNAGIKIIDKITRSTSLVKQNNDFNTKHIEKRIIELIQRHPEKTAILEKYLQNQIDESKDLETNYAFAIYLIAVK